MQNSTARAAACAAMGGDGGDGGREGDWECAGCRNRNYAFRSLCNRCKQPRLLVDPHTPRDSKWLPRVGDWICTGCSNNNYASRNLCKKCGLLKKVAAIPAISLSGAPMLSYAQYVASSQSMPITKFNFGTGGSSALQQSIVPNSNWSYGPHSSPSWPFNPTTVSGFPNLPKDWRAGDWMCTCGFHNYSSRTQCKECNAPMPSTTMKTDTSSTLGMKRLASEELITDWDNKRPNPGNTEGPDQFFKAIDQAAVQNNGQTTELYSKYVNGNFVTFSSGQVNFQSSQLPALSGLIGKGVTQWREGDWICQNCSNHNYASRTFCNRCKNQKDSDVHHSGL